MTNADRIHPRPQLTRRQYVELDVNAQFEFDDHDTGLRERWWRPGHRFSRTIRLPFAPESPASGIGDASRHDVVWYRVPVGDDDVIRAGLGSQGDRLLVHFGAVDYRADVWANGVHVASHTGGHTPFYADVTDAHRAGESLVLVVRAEDDSRDVRMARGKQDWRESPHSVWYHRTTGIWRTVWLEAVPHTRIETVTWTSDSVRGVAMATVNLSSRPERPVSITAELLHHDDRLGVVTVETRDDHVTLTVPIAGQGNGQEYESLLWHPDRPELIDATLELREAGRVADVVASYLGLRSIAVSQGELLLNDRPVYVRGVLEQGYWPESHLTPPSLQAIRDEVELIKALGFNTARIHQKVEDPRFLYWCDRLGLMVWSEFPSAYEFDATAAASFAAEWLEAVRRDASHPCVIVWVPLNESWGVQHISHDKAQQDFCAGIASLTRAIDPTRPVISNDGWEHVDSDLLTIHDYESDPAVLESRYVVGSPAALINRREANGRGLVAGERQRTESVPFMLTEFGGVSFDVNGEFSDAWGYSVAHSAEQFEAALREILAKVVASSFLKGFCYTQLTDTRQETNGLCDEHRRPKVPADVIAAIVGSGDTHSS